jgi:glycosyltransferase involved in cell wall biosynthesis
VPKSILHVTFSGSGGAGEVARNLQFGQRSLGLDSRLELLTSANLLALKYKHPYLFSRALFDYSIVRKSKDSSLFSLYRSGDRVNFQGFARNNRNIVHLHWTPGIISIREIQSLLDAGTRVVWTLHDMWPLTGGCHHADGCNQYQTNCKSCPQVRGPFRKNVHRSFLEKKTTFQFHEELKLVVPSNWMKLNVEASSVFENRETYVIPNPIDDRFFLLRDRKLARKKFGISPEDFVIGCCATDLNDPRKSIDKIVNSVDSLNSSSTDRKVKVFAIGESRGRQWSRDVVSPGLLKDKDQLAEAYHCMDVFVSVSEAENFPLTLIEAAASKVPSVCLNRGGMSEIVLNEVTGIVIGSSQDLVTVLRSLLDDPLKLNSMAEQARANAKHRYSLQKVVDRYNGVYDIL